MNQPKRTYTLEQASQELNISPETLERLLPNLSRGSQREGDQISEDELNQIVDLLNDPNNTTDKGTSGTSASTDSGN